MEWKGEKEDKVHKYGEIEEEWRWQRGEVDKMGAGQRIKGVKGRKGMEGKKETKGMKKTK